MLLQTLPSYLSSNCDKYFVPPIIFCSGSKASLTPKDFAVDGINCITPWAPQQDTALALKLDSALHTAFMREAGTLYFSEAFVIIESIEVLSCNTEEKLVDVVSVAAEAGANVFVAGSAVFGAADPAEEIEKLRNLAAKA